jgi:hypothetical protein
VLSRIRNNFESVCMSDPAKPRRHDAAAARRDGGRRAIVGAVETFACTLPMGAPAEQHQSLGVA